MADLSVVIVSYNNQDVITNCLNSIIKYNDIGNQLQVIVVEQSPQNDIYEFLKKEFPWIYVLRNENNGFGAGNNVGAELANAPYLLLLNPDTVLLEPVFSFAVKKFQENPKLGLFGVQLLDANHNKNSSFMMKVPYGIKNKIKYKICNKLNYFNSKTMYIQGADMFIRRDVFEKIGKFDDNIFMYCEETDLCIRIAENGYRIEYYPSKKIIHLEGKSTNSEYSTVLEKQIESFQYICNKHNIPFNTVIKKEYQSQKIKMLIYKVSQREKIDYQKRLMNTIKAFI